MAAMMTGTLNHEGSRGFFTVVVHASSGTGIGARSARGASFGTTWTAGTEAWAVQVTPSHQRQPLPSHGSTYQPAGKVGGGGAGRGGGGNEGGGGDMLTWLKLIATVVSHPGSKVMTL